MNNNSNKIWFNDPKILFDFKKLGELWPSSKMSFEERLNAMTRLIILLTLIGYLVSLSSKIFIVGITGILSILILYTIQTNRIQNKSKEGFINNLVNSGPLLANPAVFELNKIH